MSAPVTCRGTEVVPDALVRDLMAAGFEVGPPTPLAATVLDTFDGRVHEAGLRLEQRAEALVLTGPGTSVASLPTTTAPRFASELPAGPLRARLADVTEIRTVLPTTSMTAVSRRAERRNGDDKVVAAVVIQQRITVDGEAIDGWLVGVEALTGYERQADEAREVVAPHVGAPEDGDAVDVALAIAGVDRRGRHVDPGIALDPDLPAVEGFRLVLANLAEAIEVNLPGTLADLDPEFLHDLRVAVRRTRSILRHGRQVLAPAILAWAEPAMRSLGDLTSHPRDLDVQVIEWDERVASLGSDDARRDLEPLRRQVVADRAAAHDELTRRLGGGDVRQLLDQWHAMLANPMDPHAGGPHAGDPIGAVTADRIRKAQRRLLDAGRAITPETPAEHVHDVRKDAKKLRYLLECFAGVLPSGDRKAFVKRLKRLQDLLGAHQDAEVQAASLRTAADELPSTTSPATYLAVGRLVEQLETARHTSREGFADRFAEYDSAPARATLREMLVGLAPVKVLATYSIKGGVGKTTAAVNLAAEAARAGARVLLWDLDPQGAATFFVRVKPRLKGGAERLVSKHGGLAEHVRATDVAGVDVLPADFSLRHLDLHLDAAPTGRLSALLDPIAPDYDVALLDCAPGITLTSEGVFEAADALLVPTIPATLSARTLEQLDRFLGRLDDPPIVLPFLSMIDRRRTVHREVAAALGAAWPRLLSTQVPNVASVERMGVERAPLAVFAPTGRGTIAYRDLWSEIAAQLWGA